ncbi:hypothetical protein B0H14DRAFT_2612848 [Mycena olivaceomarginata]|nr:hypothetical protein B0H14DRAFT_2612848 [Mycena olivaceomarginata]
MTLPGLRLYAPRLDFEEGYNRCKVNGYQHLWVNLVERNQLMGRTGREMSIKEQNAHVERKSARSTHGGREEKMKRIDCHMRFMGNVSRFCVVEDNGSWRAPKDRNSFIEGKVQQKRGRGLGGARAEGAKGGGAWPMGAAHWLSPANANIVTYAARHAVEEEEGRCATANKCNVSRCGAERACDDGFGREDGGSVRGRCHGRRRALRRHRALADGAPTVVYRLGKTHRLDHIQAVRRQVRDRLRDIGNRPEMARRIKDRRHRDRRIDLPLLLRDVLLLPLPHRRGDDELRRPEVASAGGRERGRGGVAVLDGGAAAVDERSDEDGRRTGWRLAGGSSAMGDGGVLAVNS